MSLKKPSDLFEQKTFLTEDCSLLERSSVGNIPLRYSSENFARYKNQVHNNAKSLNKIDEVSAMIDLLREEVAEKIDKKDLDTALYSYLTVLDDNFKIIEDYVKGANRTELIDFKKSVSELYDLVNGLLEEEIPKYRKQIKKGEVFASEQIKGIREELENKLNNIAEVIDSNLQYFNTRIDDNVKKVNENVEICADLTHSLKEKYSKDSKKLLKLEGVVNSRLDSYEKNIINIKSDITINEQHIKSIDNYLKENHQDLIDLKEQVLLELSSITPNNFKTELKRLEKKIDFIKETYSQIDPETIVKQVISESTSEPPNVKNSDPLTPLDKKFVTFDQLQEHYRLFLNRVQQQVSTLGGGGETQLKYLDDIVGIATNASAYDGQYLRYDHTLGKFVFSTPAADYSVDNWVDGPDGVYTQSYVGVGITLPQVQLDVVGTTQIIGQVNITGNMNVSGIVTATDFDSLSDVNLKTNVVVIENPLDKVVQLRGVNFEWKEDNRPSMGVIAQEVEEILPQLVHGHETKTVNYNGLIGLLIECVKKQQEEIDELKKRLP